MIQQVWWLMVEPSWVSLVGLIKFPNHHLRSGFVCKCYSCFTDRCRRREREIKLLNGLMLSVFLWFGIICTGMACMSIKYTDSLFFHDSCIMASFFHRCRGEAMCNLLYLFFLKCVKNSVWSGPHIGQLNSSL